MKKFFVLLLAIAGTLTANAQFEKGTFYGDISLTGFGIGYSHNDFAIGIGTGLGYYVRDGWMLGGRAGYSHCGSDRGYIQGLFRYSFKSNGLNLGCGLQYEHAGQYTCNQVISVTDPTDPSRTIEQTVPVACGGDYFQICPQVGYTFYVSHYLAIEPAIYADICLNDIKYGTNFGLKIGIGLYTNKKDVKSTKAKIMK